jgi:hypothetical protein
MTMDLRDQKMIALYTECVLALREQNLNVPLSSMAYPIGGFTSIESTAPCAQNANVFYFPF